MYFISNHLGELFALLTAIFWTITALAFESASLKVGSLVVNLIRLLIGFLFLSIFTIIARNKLLPTDANLEQWIWLSISGFIGFTLGDLFLLKSFTIIGSRIAMLIMALVPPLAAFMGWLILGETLTMMNLLGMILTFTGISLAIFSKEENSKKISLKFSVKGLLFALGGAVGQALGLVLSKYGMNGYDAFASTQIRIISGILGFSVLITILKRWRPVYEAFYHKHGMIRIVIGSLFGPFLGVSFSLLALKYTQAGIASTIMAIVPVLIIVPAVIVFKQKVTWIEALGALISVVGVSLFFI
jgi:drug/metabolite transporter (DMT)-like permease